MQVFAFLTVLVLGLIALGIVSIIFKFLAKDSSPVTDSDESRMIQQLYKTLNRLEKRIEVLETLLGEYSSDNSGNTGKNTGRL